MEYVTKVNKELDSSIPGMVDKGLAAKQAAFFKVVEQKDDGIARRMLNEIAHHLERSSNAHAIVSDTIAGRHTIYSGHISRSNLTISAHIVATYHNERWLKVPRLCQMSHSDAQWHCESG